MECISAKRCIIGEGPIWNKRERLLYHVNGFANEICILDITTGDIKIRKNINAAAIAFNTDNRMIISSKTGIYYLDEDDSQEILFPLSYGNDMKIGPDGRIYVGTQSSKVAGLSNDIDGKLYCIDEYGKSKILLDNLGLSNGMEWSMDEKRFYHTDSATQIIKEYFFDRVNGDISYTGRSLEVNGVDGFTIDSDDKIYAACWGYGHVAVVDTKLMKIIDYISVPANIPASCAFCGDDMNFLAITTACYEADMSSDKNAGLTFITELKATGRLPYMFGGKYI